MQLLHLEKYDFSKTIFSILWTFFLCLSNEYFVEKFLLQISQQKSILKRNKSQIKTGNVKKI